MSSSENILLEKKRNLATLTINRPEKMNALTLQMMRDFRDFFLELEKDTKTTVVLVQAAGDKAFSAGVDSKEILTLPPDKKAEVYELMVELGQLALHSDKLLIGVLNGLMLGMGTALALAMDLRIAVNRPDTFMQMLEVDVGMFPFFVMGLGFYHFPPAFATKLVFGGEKCDLAQMQHFGFIHSTFSPEDLEKGVKKVVRTYTNKRPEMIRLSKECLCQERELLLKQIEIEHGYSKKFYQKMEEQI